MKCPCGDCEGFGQKFKNSKSVNLLKSNGLPIDGIEYPGIHRALAWLFRAALFYTAVKDKSLGYKFLKISSGYRCWNDNKVKGRQSVNHMGNALDIQFSRNHGNVRCTGSDLENLRRRIFVERLGAKMGWSTPNCASLESASDGATTWVHVDVRQFSEEYKLDKYYAVTQADLDGTPLMNIAKSYGNLALLNCGGIPKTSTSSEVNNASYTLPTHF